MDPLQISFVPSHPRIACVSVYGSVVDIPFSVGSQSAHGYQFELRGPPAYLDLPQRVYAAERPATGLRSKIENNTGRCTAGCVIRAGRSENDGPIIPVARLRARETLGGCWSSAKVREMQAMPFGSTDFVLAAAP
jgi:hypothetical protein